MKYYLTTPIYYVNAAPHIGHAYTTIAADTIARYKRMQGYDVVLPPGTDEHGQKIERAAQAAGKSPQEVRRHHLPTSFRSSGRRSDLRIDRFQRTTDPRASQDGAGAVRRCLENGYIYKGSYTGQYCVFDELYVNDAKPGDPCPDCGRADRNRHRRELLLQAFGIHAEAAGALRGAAGFHPARNAAQRSASRSSSRA